MLSNKLAFTILLLFAGIFFLSTLLVINKNPANTKIPQFGHATDYSWVLGQLEYSGLEGGFWIIRYGETTDKFGGKFVLGNDPRLANFKNGDLVKITGKVSAEQVSIYQAGILYTIESIVLLK